MVSDMKNLHNPTLSYGAFACRLEGFDDPFSTMHALVEYLRTLSTSEAKAESTSPDLEKLKAIAEESGRYQVNVHQQDDGTVVFALDDTSSPLVADPIIAPPAPSSDVDSLPEDAVDQNSEDGVADKLSRIREAVIKRNSAGFVEDPEAEDIISDPLLDDAETSVATTEPDIGAEAPLTLPDTSELDHIADDEDLDPDIEDVAADAADNLANEVIEDDAVTGAFADGVTDDVVEDDVTRDIAEDGVAEDCMTDDDTTTAQAEDEADENKDGPDAVETPPHIVGADPQIKENIRKLFTPENDSIEFHAENEETSDHMDDMTSEPHRGHHSPAPDNSGALDDIASMLESIAASLNNPQTDTKADDSASSTRPDATEDTGLRQALARATQETQPHASADDTDIPEDAVNIFDDSDVSVVRLLNETDREMAKGEHTRRHNSIQLLKAAADVFRGEKSDRNKLENAHDGAQAYKEDLARAVHHGHDDEDHERPLPPLMLASEQRVDVSPLVLGSSSDAPRLEDDALSEGVDLEPEYAKAPSEIVVRFAEYAQHSGEKTLPALFEAAIAFLTNIGKQPAASRLQIMQLASVALGKDVSEEETLRALGELLHEDKIIKVKRDHFSLS